MIKRIVKLGFKVENISLFKEVFEESKEKISNFEGCYHVELLQCKNPENIFFTFSIWESEDALNKYRHSPFFQKTWEKTKVLFNTKPEAWSVSLVDQATKK